ncbi:MAG: GUN4 domain-containing protein [Brasilonema angustatum HA4187-MV1]|jgi:serine/threonine protein kinase|nr:GUN4 domain-containing protein [Brasilonema angustatum HA4187-MV1]
MMWIPGQKLQGGKYTLEKKLGQGGCGVTYLAKNTNNNQVVIKILKNTDTDTCDFDKYQQDFVNEALKLKGCQHPHIVKVYELIKQGDLWGMVMEYIEGENIGNQALPLPESEALLYIHQIGDALKVVHNNGLLHRDVNPNNIMVRAGKSEAVLIDFGIAREFTPDLTQTHTVIRTPFYAPPEQENPRAKRGAYTDVYSLAATLYKLLTGNEPESAISRMFGEPLKPPKELNSNINDRVNQAILQGMELRPENRPQSMQEWLALLDIKFPSTPPVNPSPPISTVGIDYSNLNKLLATGRWKEADEETKAIMLRVSGRETEGCLDNETILKFPCQDLLTINQLWMKYSNGHFGFSVQKSIWQSVGGKPGEFNLEHWVSFGEHVGWRSTRHHQIFFASWTSREWSYYSQINFSLDAPEGHLPRIWDEWRGGLELSAIALRLLNCDI